MVIGEATFYHVILGNLPPNNDYYKN